jgi:hypothetical protein
MLHSIPDELPHAAALRYQGKVYENTSHPEAFTDMLEKLGIHDNKEIEKLTAKNGPVEAGFTTKSGKWLTRDEAANLTGDDHASGAVWGDRRPSIADLVESEGQKPTAANIARMRDKLETSLGTYFADRADIAIPTPGAKERKFSTWGMQAGTPQGEFARLAMMFKSFPITIMSKILGRDVYGNGADTVKQWLLKDNRGKFNMAMTIAMMTVAGYISETLHGLTKGKAPAPLAYDGKPDWDNIQKIMVRGGSLGLFGETTMGEFSGSYRSYLEYAAGPTFGQVDNLFNIKNSMEQGKNQKWPATKLLLDNTPFANLFYFRPVLDYFVLWNLQNMLSPGSLERSESRTETQNHQQYLVKPSEHVGK